MAEMTDAATVTSQTTIGVSQVRQGLISYSSRIVKSFWVPRRHVVT